ncbi:hypothetical protein M885DRAFT_559296 [Pelagophyceae sp. CCMP2097]|nr:hypothetical protein M885DRAFT_559296 [Pelagophyceae sp. CCMP2097]
MSSSIININTFHGLDRQLSEETEDPGEWLRQFKAYRKTNKNKLTAEQILDIFESKVEASRAGDVEDFRESYKVGSLPPSTKSADYETEFATWNGDLLDALLIKMEDNFKANSSLRSDRHAHEQMDIRQKDDESGTSR